MLCSFVTKNNDLYLVIFHFVTYFSIYAFWCHRPALCLVLYCLGTKAHEWTTCPNQSLGWYFKCACILMSQACKFTFTLLGRYQIVLPGDKGTWMNNLPKSISWLWVWHTNHYATKPKQLITVTNQCTTLSAFLALMRHINSRLTYLFTYVTAQTNIHVAN